MSRQVGGDELHVAILDAANSDPDYRERNRIFQEAMERQSERQAKMFDEMFGPEWREWDEFGQPLTTDDVGDVD